MVNGGKAPPPGLGGSGGVAAAAGGGGGVAAVPGAMGQNVVQQRNKKKQVCALARAESTRHNLRVTWISVRACCSVEVDLPKRRMILYSLACGIFSDPCLSQIPRVCNEQGILGNGSDISCIGTN